MDTESSVVPATSAQPADWIVADAAEDWANTVRWGPRGFAVYARVDFVPPGVEPGSTDDNELYDVVFAVLARFTGTPSQCWAAVWEGWCGEEAPTGSRGALVSIPNREMLLYEADVSALADVPHLAWQSPSPSQIAPHLSWPEDRRWCVAVEVDEELAFTVACSEEAYAALVAALPGQVRRAAWGDPEPMYADTGDGQPIDPRGLGEPIPPGAPGWQRYAAVGLLGGFGLGGMHDG